MKNSLLVIWQDTSTRQKYHIGTLNYNLQNQNYEFTYAFDVKRRGLQEAQKVGFRGIHEFELKEGTVRSRELFHFFNKRLPNPKRSDYNRLLQYFGLNQDPSKMEFLRRTKGRLATDSFELFSSIIKHEEENNFELETFIEGWQYYDGDKVLDSLNVEDELMLVREPDNEFDKYAVKILTKSGVMLGYIAAVYSEFISGALDSNQKCNVSISNKYPNAIPQMKVWVEIKGRCTFRSCLSTDNTKELKRQLVLN